LRRSGEGVKGKCLPWSKEEEGAYIFWMKQVPVELFVISALSGKILKVFVNTQGRSLCKTYRFPSPLTWLPWQSWQFSVNSGLKQSIKFDPYSADLGIILQMFPLDSFEVVYQVEGIKERGHFLASLLCIIPATPEEWSVSHEKGGMAKLRKKCEIRQFKTPEVTFNMINWYNMKFLSCLNSNDFDI
jgi:hypothetical protein